MSVATARGRRGPLLPATLLDAAAGVKAGLAGVALVAVGMVSVSPIGPAAGAAAASNVVNHQGRHDGGRPSPATTGPSTAERRAASVATTTFHADIVVDAAAFVTAVSRLGSVLRTGDVAGSRAAELTAQSDFDWLRLLGTPYTGNEATVDGTSDGIGAGHSFGGLHAVEEALWSPVDSAPAATAAAVAAATGLEAQAPVTEYLLDKVRLDPEPIGTTAVQELEWVTDVALAGREEEYSHRDEVDVAATIGASDQAFEAIEPLATLVDPVDTSQVARQYASLVGTVDALGPPADIVDSAVPADTRLQLSQRLDATAALLARLAARLAPFGTRGPPP